MIEEVSRDELQRIRKSLGISVATPPHIQLKQVRERLGWTQADLAEKLDVDTGTISRWENRVRKRLTSKQRRNLQKFLGIPAHAWGKEAGQMGSGPDRISVHLSQEFSPQEKLPPSLWHVPYARNPYFTDQRNLVQALRDRLTAKEPEATCQAIGGLGGIGKTQLALAYAYQYQNEYTAVLWVGAGTQTQLFKDLVRIGRLLHVPETQKDTPQQRYVINEALHWFQKKSGWLLVLDNVEEDLDAEENKATEEKALTIERLLTMPHKGHILLTTRSQALARRVQHVTLEEMPPEEGALLLQEGQASSPHLLRLASDAHREEALTLSQLLGGLPLALEQARAYIEATGCGLNGYRQLYETYRKDLLQSLAKGSRLEKEYKASVATTWLISFRRVEQQLAVASDVLKLYAYVAPDAIPEEMLLKGAEKLDGRLHQLAGNRFQFNRVCEVLLNYSLIKRNADEAALSLHRLVQAVLQDHMDDETQHHWAEQAVQAVEYAFSDALSTQQDIERYLPHARLCATFIKKLDLKGQEMAHLLEMAALAVYERGWYAQARPFYLRAYAAATDLFGNKDPHTLSLLLEVARVHMDLHAFPLSAALYQSVKGEYEQLFGSDSPEVIACLNNLALAQFKTGDRRGAEQTCKEILACYTRVKIPDAAQQATTYHLAAQISASLFANNRTEAYYKAAIEKQRQVFGEDHPEVAKSIANLGVFYTFLQKDFEQAELLLWQAVEMQQRILGRDHPETAACFSQLAGLLLEKKNYGEAEHYYQEALEIRQQKLGLYHPDVLYTFHDLAVLAAEQRKDQEAEHYFQQMLTIAPYAGGTESYEYAILLKAYTDFLQNCGRADEATEYNKQIANLLKRLKIHGPLHSLGFFAEHEGEQTTPSASMWFFRR